MQNYILEIIDLHKLAKKMQGEMFYLIIAF